jgi:hypothetical protein
VLRQGLLTQRRSGLITAPNHYMGIAATIEFMRGRPLRAARLLAVAR